MSDTINMYITDKTGKQGFKIVCRYGYHTGELHNLQRNLAMIKAGHPAFVKCGYDAASAELIIIEPEKDSLEDLLAWIEGETA